MGKRNHTEVLPANLEEHAAARACRQVLPEWSAVAGIEILQLQQKSAVYRLVRETGGATIIAKRCRATTAATERIVYDGLGALIPPPAFLCRGYLPEADGKSWLFFDDAGRGEYLPSCPTHRVLAGRWLATIHGVALASGLAARLPRRDADYYLTRLRPARETLRGHIANPFLPEDDVATLRALVADCDRLEARWREVERICSRAPRTLVHGDFVRKNMRIRETAEGPAFWAFDWEHAGWGVPAIDLAQSNGHSASPDLETYGQELRKFVPEMEDGLLQQLARCGKLFRVVEAIAWECPTLCFRPYEFLASAMSCLGVYRARLQEGLEAAGWARN